jgi:hypothetical protein
MTFWDTEVFEDVAIRFGLFFDREDRGVRINEVRFLGFVVAPLRLEG